MSKPTYKSTVLITGGTTGLGYETAFNLAKHFPSHQIIVASRSNKDDAAGKINRYLHQSNTTYLPLDLSSSDSIKAFASTIMDTYPKITHLLLNAGLQFPGPVSTLPNGIESTFGINHLGHAQLFYVLLPHLTADAHIILTSSGTHDPKQKTGMPEPTFPSAEAVARPHPKTANPDGRVRYTTSKLCNIMWTYSLDRHIKSSGKSFTVNAFDPGLVPGTNLAREYNPIARFLWLHIMPRILPLMRILISANIHTAKESGAALARLAIGEEDGVKAVSGQYWEGRKEIRSGELSYDEAKQEDLWGWTVRYLAEGDEVKKAKWERLEG